jgi:hypothetical protein
VTSGFDPTATFQSGIAALPVGAMLRRMSATGAEQRTMVGAGAEVIKNSSGYWHVVKQFLVTITYIL